MPICACMHASVFTFMVHVYLCSVNAVHLEIFAVRIFTWFVLVPIPSMEFPLFTGVDT